MPSATKYRRGIFKAKKIKNQTPHTHTYQIFKSKNHIKIDIIFIFQMGEKYLMKIKINQKKKKIAPQTHIFTQNQNFFIN